MKILVTGAAGFLGSTLCRTLAMDGNLVTGLDVIHPHDAWRLQGVLGRDSVRYIWGSMIDSLPACGPQDAVVNCAAITDVGLAHRGLSHARALTIDPAIALVEWLRHNPVGQVVQISTHSVYGKPQGEPSVGDGMGIVDGEITEDCPTAPTSVYGLMKLFQESLLRILAETEHQPLTVLRSTLMYGPGERGGALVRSFLTKALRDETIFLEGGGEQTRDFNHVMNMAEAVRVVLAYPPETAPGQFGPDRVYNIGSGENIRIKDLAALAIRESGKGRVEIAPPRPGEEGSLFISSRKAREGLGYLPTVTFEEGFVGEAQALRAKGGGWWN